DLHGDNELLLTQEQLADMLCARRTSVTLIAQTLQEAEIINYRRGRMIIRDIVKLQNIACECYRTVESNYEALRCKDHVQVKRYRSDTRTFSASFNVSLTLFSVSLTSPIVSLSDAIRRAPSMTELRKSPGR